MKNYQIYSLKEPNTDIVKYIGITGRTLHARLIDHLNEKGSAPKHNWIKRLKSQSLKPEIELLEDGLQLEDALQKEKQYILLFKSLGANLKNLTLGGEGVFGYKRTQEQKDHLREVHKGRWAGEKNPMYGKKLTEEHKNKMREAQRIKGCSQETREKRRIAMTGQKRSPDQLKRMSEAHKGIKHTEASKLKISLSKKGKKVSEERRRQMIAFARDHHPMRGKHYPKEMFHIWSNAQKGKKLSEAHKQKIRETNIRLGRMPVIKRGSEHWFSKLKESDIIEIRRLYSEGGITQQKIAEMFNTVQSVIGGIITRKAWRHVK